MMAPDTKFFGLDLTSSDKKASAFALLDSQPLLWDSGYLKTDEDILNYIRKHQPVIVAIDAPLGFPKGLCCLEESCPCKPEHPFKGRLCERELARCGIGSYYTTKRSIIKSMVYRAVALRRTLENREATVLEVYPYASKVRLFGRPIPKKTSPEGITFLQQKLSRLIKGIPLDRGNHDLLDAIVAAYTACLHCRGETESVGDPEEWAITVPKGQASTLNSRS